jgi:hypothetical protein
VYSLLGIAHTPFRAPPPLPIFVFLEVKFAKLPHIFMFWQVKFTKLFGDEDDLFFFLSFYFGTWQTTRYGKPNSVNS